MNQVQRSATIRRSRAIVSLILLTLLGTAALAIAPLREATAAPAAQTCFSGPCPTPRPTVTPTPGPVCPARTPSSKPIGNILDLSENGGVKVVRIPNQPKFEVTFILVQPNHMFNPGPPCFFDDEVATRFEQSPNIQDALQVSLSASQAIMDITVANVNQATIYRFRVKYQQNFDGNPKFRTCTLAIPSGLTPGQPVGIPPTACSDNG